MTKLTEKQERFCRLIVEGKTQREAYVGAGYTAANENSLDANAAAVIRNDKVASRIAELRAPANKKAEMTLAYLQRRAKRLLDKAEKAGQFAAANGALKELGILSGLRVEKRENRNINDPLDLDDTELAHIASAGSAGAIAEAGRAKGSDPIH